MPKFHRHRHPWLRRAMAITFISRKRKGKR